ncbi:hypothetical protein BKA65DRAFT_483681 [Rhexocercosporidium sp. MPI-PUGE-AT-0058]|nr:hypothetical protein BKA65DRAFT_483681 [Rhexocercosporidium sp. MPI-PUGE-AT-0058]
MDAAGFKREDIALAPISIMDDTAPTGDFVLLSQSSEDIAEDVALASIIKETIPSDIKTSIREEASTYVNILDLASGTIIDEDSIIVAIDEIVLILIKETSGEELSVISVSIRNVDYNIIIIKKEEDVRFELNKEGLQAIIIEDFNNE